MASHEVFMSREGYEKLRNKLKEMKRKRPEISSEIGRAREMGDLKENAEYHAAKETLAHLQERIFSLETRLRNARMIEDKDLPDDTVCIGATVVLKDMKTEEDIKWVLVSADEADIIEGKISIESPMAQGLLGHKAGDAVKITVPAGVKEYRIISISRQ